MTHTAKSLICCYSDSSEGLSTLPVVDLMAIPSCVCSNEMCGDMAMCFDLRDIEILLVQCNVGQNLGVSEYKIEAGHCAESDEVTVKFQKPWL